MKRLLDIGKRVWNTLRILSLLKSAWEFMRDHWDDISGLLP